METSATTPFFVQPVFPLIYSSSCNSFTSNFQNHRRHAYHQPRSHRHCRRYQPMISAISSSSSSTTKTSSTSASSSSSSSSRSVVTVLDYGAGNVRSLENALRLLGVQVEWACTPDDIRNADRLIFPGVGSFGAAMNNLNERNFASPLKEYIASGKPFFGICLGLHTLFSASEESPNVKGLDIFPGTIRRFDDENDENLSIPHIGWNCARATKSSWLLDHDLDTDSDRFYFVHSYRVGLDIAKDIDYAVLAMTVHGKQPYVSILQHENIIATQFHPEKSGAAGLALLRNFLSFSSQQQQQQQQNGTRKYYPLSCYFDSSSTRQQITSLPGLAKRVVACLDVRENDDGDLVVTKGDQYDVRESQSGNVRNLGKPISLAQRYFREGADEIVFLNITSFRGEPISCTPMIQVLKETSERVFVPLCIGGGIRDYKDKSGKFYSALNVADMYFRAGADKISIGSDAVYSAEDYYKNGCKKTGTSSIEQISHVYGRQAVVVSIDPRRMILLNDNEKQNHTIVKFENGEKGWFQCTVKGGREGRNIDVVALVKAVEELGAGEILLNSMDCDGQNNGYDIILIDLVKKHCQIPVIASSGAGNSTHFQQCFEKTNVEAALAAGIFHRKEIEINDVKNHLKQCGTVVREARAVDDVVGVDVIIENGK